MTPITVSELYHYFNSLISPSLSLKWDNDGLMCCPNPQKRVKRVLLALDATFDTVKYAAEHFCDVIITHHPVIFKPLKSLVSPKLIYAVQHDISIFSFHTRLDIVENGVNDRLASLLGLANTVPFAENAGRIGHLGSPMEFKWFCAFLKEKFHCRAIQAVNAGGMVSRVAVVSGSGGDFTGEAAALSADTFVSGEIGYHALCDCMEMGINAVQLGHYNSEVHILSFFEEKIRNCDCYDNHDIEILYYDNNIITDFL